MQHIGRYKDKKLDRTSQQGIQKKLFAIKIFKFCHLKTQQRFFLDKKLSITKKELTSVRNRLRHFLKQYDHARKATQYPTKTVTLIGYTLWKDELVSNCYLDIEEHTDRQPRTEALKGTTTSHGDKVNQ